MDRLKGIEILRNLPDGLLVVEVKTRKVIEINPVASNLFGCMPDELINQDVLLLHPVSQRKRIKKLISNLAHKKSTYLVDTPFVRKNGEIFFVDIALTKLNCNTTQIVLEFLRDRSKIINRLSNWNLLYEQLTEMIGYGVCITSNKRFVYINNILADLLGGKSPAEFIEKDVFTIVPEPERESVQCLYENLMSGKIPAIVRKQKIKRLDGKEIEVFFKAMKIIYNGEPSVHCVVIPANLTLKEGFVNTSNLSDSQKLISTLTKRETEILCLLAGSYTTKEIAGRLKIAYHTVMTHKHSIMKKLQCKTLVDLTIFAIKNGIVKT